MRVRINEIKMPKSNFRKAMDIEDLKKNMEVRGQLEPILVSEDGTLVAGARRLMAAKALGWQYIDCFFKDYSEVDTALRETFRIADGIFENIKRKSLLPGEEAAALAWLEKNWKAKGLVTIKKDTGRTKASSKGNGQNNSGNRSCSKKSFAGTMSDLSDQSKTTISMKSRVGRLMSPSVHKALDEREITLSQAELLVGKDLALAPEKQDVLLPQIKGKNLQETKVIANNYFAQIENPSMTHTKNGYMDRIDGIAPRIWLTRCAYEMSQLAEKLNRAMKEGFWASNKEGRDILYSQVLTLFETVSRLKTMLETPSVVRELKERHPYPTPGRAA